MLFLNNLLFRSPQIFQQIALIIVYRVDLGISRFSALSQMLWLFAILILMLNVVDMLCHRNLAKAHVSIICVLDLLSLMHKTRTLGPFHPLLCECDNLRIDSFARSQRNNQDSGPSIDD